MIVSQSVITQFGQQSPSGDGSYIPVTEQPVIVKVDGLVDGELLKVEYSLIGADVWIPFSPRGAQIVISKDRNPIVLKVPGRYRVVQVTPGPTAATIQTIQATLSHDFLWSLTDPVIAPRGLKGDPGISGGGGGSGSTWRVGSTTPSDALGIDGDLFLNSLTGDFYVKTGGAYLLQGSLRGSDGANGINGTNGAPGDQGLPGTPGSPGTVWRSGIGVIGDGIGINGDFYLNTANGDVYERQLGGYTLVGNIKGVPGANGIDGISGSPGTVWRNAAGAPSGALGLNGDYYLNSANGDYYLKISGSYVLQGSLVGPVGPVGPVGAGGQSVVLPVVSGDYIQQSIGPTVAPAAFSLEAQVLLYTPFIGRSFSAVALAMRGLANAANTFFRLGLYDSDGSEGFFPGTLLRSVGPIDGGTVNGLKEAPIAAFTIVPNHLYWLAIQTNSSNVIGSEAFPLSDVSTLSLGSIVTGGAHAKMLRVASPSGVTPPALPSPSTVTRAARFVPSSTSMPWIFLKAA